MKILILGRGYIGQRCARAWGDEVVVSDTRLDTVQTIAREIEKFQPDVVLNAAGVVGKPNVDWCDSHPLETIRGNTMLPLMIAQACAELNIYLLHIGSGCIFYGDSPHPDRAWREDDFANPEPVYTRSKWAADLALSTLPHVGIARIRMPLDWQPHRANLIDKLAAYTKVIDVENSVTVLDDMVDVFYKLLSQKASGIFHVTNPGSVRHRDILAWYREFVDPNHTCEWITAEQLVSQGLASKARSNNILASENLGKLGITMRPVDQAVRDTMMKYASQRQSGLNS